jgi:hypothetical protein
MKALIIDDPSISGTRAMVYHAAPSSKSISARK